MDPQKEIWDRHSAALRRFARHLSGEASQADDLVSEAFVRLWTTTSPIRTDTVRAYLFAIVRNLYARSRRHARQMVEATEDLASYAVSPHELAEQHQEIRQVRRALAALDDDDRAALLMRAEGDLSYDDIGVALRVSAGAARVRVHRARRQLLEAMGTRKEQS